MKSTDLSASDVQAALMLYFDPEKAKVLPKFFKTGKGEYGEGDQFIGVAVPNVRKVAKECRSASFELIEELLNSEIHECRSCALMILTEQFNKAKKEENRKAIYDFYLSHTQRINNWDLVDCSCYAIVGTYLLDKPRHVLYQMISDPLLWNKRIAIVSCMAFIRKGDFEDIFALTEKLLSAAPNPHDLMQKACGWMLREVGKHGGTDQLKTFLECHAATMPRTMLRYAIEKMDAIDRQYFMSKKSELLGNPV